MVEAMEAVLESTGVNGYELNQRLMRNDNDVDFN